MEGSFEICYLSALFLRSERTGGAYADRGSLHMFPNYPEVEVLTLITNHTKIAKVEITTTELSDEEEDFADSSTTATDTCRIPVPTTCVSNKIGGYDIRIYTDNPYWNKDLVVTITETSPTPESPVFKMTETSNESDIDMDALEIHKQSSTSSLTTTVTTNSSEITDVFEPLHVAVANLSISSKSGFSAQLDEETNQTFITTMSESTKVLEHATSEDKKVKTSIHSSMITPVKNPSTSLIQKATRTMLAESQSPESNLHSVTTTINAESASTTPNTGLQTEATSLNIDDTNTTTSARSAAFIPIVLPQAIDLKNVQSVTTTALSQITQTTQIHVQPTMTAMLLSIFYEPCHRIEDPNHSLVRASVICRRSSTDDGIEQIKNEEIQNPLCSIAEDLTLTIPDSVDDDVTSPKPKSEDNESDNDNADRVTSPKPNYEDDESDDINIYCRECEYSSLIKENQVRYMCQPYALRRRFNHKSGTVSCSRCDCAFTTMLDLKLHIRLRHPALYLCNYCECSSIIKNDLLLHIDEVHTPDFKNALDNNTLQVMLYEVHKEMHFKTFGCFICISAHRNEEKLKEHLFDKHGVVLCYGCGFCDYTCFDVLELTTHLLIHQEGASLAHYRTNTLGVPQVSFTDRIFFCNLCAYACRVKETIKMHKYIHTIYCVHCNYVCDERSSMSYHKCCHKKQAYEPILESVWTHDRPLQCDDCYFHSDNEETMMEHVRKNFVNPNPINRFASYMSQIAESINNMRSPRCKSPKKCTKNNPCKYCIKVREAEKVEAFFRFFNHF